MTYRVVKDEPCNWPTMHDDGVCEAQHPCYGCNGDGTRMVEVDTPDDATILIHKGDIYVMRKAHT